MFDPLSICTGHAARDGLQPRASHDSPLPAVPRSRDIRTRLSTYPSQTFAFCDCVCVCVCVSVSVCLCLRLISPRVLSSCAHFTLPPLVPTGTAEKGVMMYLRSVCVCVCVCVCVTLSLSLSLSLSVAAAPCSCVCSGSHTPTGTRDCMDLPCTLLPLCHSKIGGIVASA